MSENINIVLLSDTHINIPFRKAKRMKELQKALVNIESNLDFDGLAILGDLSDHGREFQLKSFAKVVQAFTERTKTNLLINLGNHDVFHCFLYKRNTLMTMNLLRKALGQSEKAQMYDEVIIKGVPFLMLNSDEGIRTSCHFSIAQQHWLKERLCEHRDKQIVCILNHQPLSNTHKGSKEYGLDKMDEQIKAILSPYNNVVWLSGHIHNGPSDIQKNINEYGIQIDVPSFQLTKLFKGRSGSGCILKIRENRVYIQVWDFLEMSLIKDFIIHEENDEEILSQSAKDFCVHTNYL